MTENHLLYLLNGRLSGQLIEAELQELEVWIGVHPEANMLLERFTNEDELQKELAIWRSIDPSQGYANWWFDRRTRRKVSIRRIAGWSIAASLLIAAALFTLVRKSMPKEQAFAPIAPLEKPIAPGRNTAVLTLGSGEKLLLDSAVNGELTMQGKTRLIKKDSGSLSYIASSNSEVATISYNTLTTPSSGQYRLILPDGSRVWLNNISSLRYPTSFVDKNRIVELSGEAYFEIANDPSKPFIVKANGEEVRVLGTSFNLMSYPDEATTQTTLLTGSVQVKEGVRLVQLKPDEQARVGKDGSLQVLKNVASQDVVSWKDGFFYFGRASFSEVMRQLARWYDVQVVYEGKIPDIEFGGKIDRNLPLQELLKFLNKNQVHFRIEGHNLIVLPS